MHKIEKTSYGYRLTWGGIIAVPEMTEWLASAKKALLTSPASFGVFVDMRDLAPLSSDATAVMQEGQKLFKAAGLARSVCILNSATTTMQFRRLARTTGIDAFERYINAAGRKDWESAGLAWLTDAVDPDLVTA